MKKLLLATLALLAYSCAQDPVEAPKADPGSDPETRAIVSRLTSNFSESLVGGTLYIGNDWRAGSPVPGGTYYNPVSMESVRARHPNADFFEATIGIRKEGASNYLITQTWQSANVVLFPSFTIPEPGRYVIRGNVAYFYSDNGVTKEGQVYKEQVIEVSLLKPGRIGSDQTIPIMTSPQPLTNVQSASGGTGPITYQWRSWTAKTSSKIISGATGATYSPGYTTETTYYQRIAKSGTQTISSNTVTITAIVPTPIIVPDKTSARVGEYAYFRVTNWPYQAGSVEWRTNGRYPRESWGMQPELSAQMADEYYLTVECRITHLGITSEWGRASVTRIW